MQEDFHAGPVEFEVELGESGQRLDAVLAARFSPYSRVHLRRVITAGGVTVNGARSKPAFRLKPGQQVRIELPELPREAPKPENIPLDILYEDEVMVAVNKPSGMVVHPARGHWSGTLASALQFHFNKLSSIGGPTRPGIVHRLDRDTSGVILVAKDDLAHAALSEQFAARSVEKHYIAIVAGVPDRDQDYIDEPIGHHPHVRDKMAIRRDDPQARPSRTFYTVIERFTRFALVDVFPKTGRTHQIRVHLDHVGWPILCDRIYGGRARISPAELAKMSGISLTPDDEDESPLLERQALHASRLSIDHPVSGERLTVEAPLADDISATLDVLRSLKKRK